MSQPDNAAGYDACYLCWGAGGYVDYDEQWHECSKCDGHGGWYLTETGDLIPWP